MYTLPQTRWGGSPVGSDTCSSTGSTRGTGISFFTGAGTDADTGGGTDRITSITDFWPEPYEPPAGRDHLTERY